MTGPQLSRRHVLAGVSAGAAAGVLTACGGQDGGEGGQGGATPPATGAAGGTAGAGALVSLADVPVGGAVSVEGPQGPLVVAQPAEGEVVAFSAVCTHQGCTVAPDGEQLRCPCHGSVFEAATGQNVSGPAPRPLDEVSVEVVDGQVVPA